VRLGQGHKRIAGEGDKTRSRSPKELRGLSLVNIRLREYFRFCLISV